MIEVMNWRGCYGKSWTQLGLPGTAMAHPAKFARSLIFRLVHHGFEQGWWEEGDRVGDPFAGVGCGGLACTASHLNWLGVEIEPEHYKTMEDTLTSNMGLWSPGRAQCSLGDSRRFFQIVRHAGFYPLAAVITSPPYAETLKNPGGVRLPDWFPTGKSHFHNPNDAYGATAGQIGSEVWEGYWVAMKSVYRECSRSLDAGGVICVIVKDYVKDGKIVELTAETVRVLSECGFDPLAEIRCSFDGHKSFFRRLNESKGQPPVDNETILAFTKG